MPRPTPILLTLLAVSVAASTAQQQDMFKYMNRIPKCAITCILQEVPQSACNTVTNATCLCNDAALREATQACVRATCESTLDALEAAKVEAEACQRPYRDRRSSLLSSIPIQVITVVFVCLRFYSRWDTSRSFAADDWIMAACLILYIPFSVIGTLVGRRAFGRDIWNVDPGDLTFALRLFYVAQTFYILCLALSKIAILVFFLRIFPSKKFRRVTHVVIFLTGLSAAIVVFVQIFQCLPVRYNWEGWKGQFGPHHCINLNALTFAAAGLSIVQDVVILVLPLPQLLRLQVSWRTKAGIVLMFSLGIFILITSCIRLRFILIFARSSNPTWDYVEALIWSGTEISVSMIIVSLPAIRLLLSRVVPGLLSTVASRTGWSFGGTQKTDKGTGSLQRRSQPGVTTPRGPGHGTKQREADVEKGISERNCSRPPSKLSSLGLYNIGCGSKTEPNESEEALELGDRSKGEVHTAVRVDTRSSIHEQNEASGRDDNLEDVSTESRIRVWTTTTVSSIREDRRSYS